ncbi:hypothetical protein AB0E56_12990 [Microbacterium sp. NPDC028030]|uniref:hypothetical protein n=1 Tax=Microbacterium sp. NPDC028030 TaxID=3155124 RepID=UPI0033C228C2
MALPAGVTQLGTFQGVPGEKGDTGTIASAGATSVPAGEAAAVVMTGPEDDKHAEFFIPRGLPGVNAVENDEAVSTYVTAEDSETRQAIDATVGPSAILNPETAQSNAVQTLIDGSLLPFQGALRTVYAGADLSTPRPDYAGPILWYVTVNGQPANAIDGDSFHYVAPEAVWTPIDIPTLWAWYDPTLLGIADGSTVTSLPDQSPNARHLNVIQGTPTLSMTGLNGTKAVSFNGASRLMRELTTVLSGPITIFTVFRATGVAGTQTVVGGRTAPASTARQLLYRSVSANVFGMNRGTLLPGTGLGSDSNIHVAVATLNGASSSLALDGTPWVSGDAGAVDLDRISLGVSPNTAGADFLTGYVGGVIIMTGVADADTITKATAFLRGRHGVV